MSPKRPILFVAALVSGPFLALAPAPARAAGGTALDVAVLANRLTGEFSTLIAAIQHADPYVVEVLSGRSPVTVFAPTDRAFAEIGLTAGNVGTLPRDQLTNILLYHVTAGRYPASRLLFTRSLAMELGYAADISIRYLYWLHYGLYINDALIIFPDIPASNGYIHVIDTVLMSPLG
jgi:uncharacterized surface protein with fasciclin (FAS1) repeats